MDLNTEENRKELIAVFKKLETDSHFEITSPKDDGYNCIAWAMGFNDRWVDHFIDTSSKKKWWPNGVKRGKSPVNLVEAFKAVGFETCDDDGTEDGFDKVALYKDMDSGRWTHAAKVLSPLKYHSKIGKSFDITHRSGDVFENSSYGTVFQFMKRKVSDRHIIEDIMRKNEPQTFDIDNIVKQILGFF